MSGFDIRKILEKVHHPPRVFLETALTDKDNRKSFLFTEFKDVITFYHKDNTDKFFKKVEDYLQKGFWVCGYFEYEFGYYLEPALYELRQKSNKPLVWLGVCKRPFIVAAKSSNSGFAVKDSYEVKNIRPDITLKEYSFKIQEIKKYLEEGLTYQVNFTFKMNFDFKGSPADFYLGLRQNQPTPYLSFTQTEDKSMLSFSPELFFRIKGNRIISRPMKGTVERGLTYQRDKYNRELLNKSSKIKAENLMIVDLLRNDLGRVAEKVGVSKLFNIERYKTLYQMTSTIHAKLKKNTKLKDIFSSLFPCGSVTGAPKIKTMGIIKSLEKEDRGIYTGAIGYISPQRKACFNVAIRTICLGHNRGEMGIGGGIVYDSIDRQEYREALLKAKFLVER